ncbi:TPA: hypothetical protein ACOVAY_000641 [Staphylococcus pseudintermedius]|nr:hypothetical protein [Staphylococcus pseudintermedius]HDT8718066.1 hypothetical protein [Staphylococcus pseudintermedius]
MEGDRVEALVDFPLRLDASGVSPGLTIHFYLSVESEHRFLQSVFEPQKANVCMLMMYKSLSR